MKTTIYIRKEDEEIWRELGNKSEWIHAHMHEEEGTATDQNIRRVVRDELDRIQSQY